MWFVRFVFQKYNFFLIFTCLLVVAEIKDLVATEISNEVILSKNDREILEEALQEDSKSNLYQYYAQSEKISDPLIKKIILHHYLVTIGTSGTFNQISSFINANPHWPRMSNLRTRAEESMTNDLSPQAILNYFGNDSPISTDGWIQYIRALLGVGHENKARRIIREI